MKKVFWFIFLVAILFYNCNISTELPHGIWRAALKTSSGAEVPFNFELTDSPDGKVIYLINGTERLKVDDITTNADSVYIKLPLFDSEIRAGRSKEGLSGKWIKHLASKDVSMDFIAQSGNAERFFNNDDQKPEYNVTGRWSVAFLSSDGKDTTLAVGEFMQNGKKVTGTFLTTSGDYRFLEGSIINNIVYLSSFDGSNAYLFTADILNNSTLTNGKFHSGLTYEETWTAHKDEHAILADPYSLTRLKYGLQRINFSFPDLEGQIVSLSDKRFKNKVVIVQFLGSWCANCMDETVFLAPFYERYKNKGVEIIGLAYERTTDPEKSKARVNQLKQRFSIDYPLLITGFTNKDVLKSMPALNEFEAFPTTILIDKKGLVRKIHTGFTGPGTGKHYTIFINEFEKQINQLIKE